MNNFKKETSNWNETGFYFDKILTLPSYGSVTEKIDTFVDFPMDLDLDPFVVGPKATTRQLYRLYAVVNHSGSLSFGHYTA